MYFYLFGYIFETLITTEGVKKILTFHATQTLITAGMNTLTVAECLGDQTLHGGA
jgi:hypothetical protein